MEGYKNLSAYILATVICDLNVEFVKQWIDYKSRTRDQMVQAGRSGKQNIAEGYAQVSLAGYIQLCGVAHGSFKELTSDYEDYLRQHGFTTWGRDDSRIRDFRSFRAVWNSTNNPNTPNIPTDPEKAANMLLTFCQMETYLLSRLLGSLRKKFVIEGGFRENLFKARMLEKNKN